MWNQPYDQAGGAYQAGEPTYPRDGTHRYNPMLNETAAGADSHTMGQQVFNQAARLGSKVLEEGQRLISKAPLIGEGPAPLRILCFLGGLGMAITGGSYIFFVFRFLSNPAVYVLNFYQCRLKSSSMFLSIFGLLIMVMEAKDIPIFSGAKKFMNEWMKFMTVPGGTLGISMYGKNFGMVVVGLYMTCMGIIATLVHLGLRKQLKQTGLITVEEEDNFELYAQGNSPNAGSPMTRGSQGYMPVRQDGM